MDDSPDDRDTELETLEAIYPEIRRANATKDPYTFELDIPVKPESPVTVTFPAAAGNDPVGANGQLPPNAPGQWELDSLQVTHLPALLLRISLPEGYPSEKPPDVKVTTNPKWLREDTLSKLAGDAPRLWEEMGRDMVAYSYIDHLQRAADDVFGAINAEGMLEIDAEHKLAVLDHDIKAKKEEFERETFDCEVCLDPKKGSKCHKMLDCGHIFCLECLQDFYNDAITEGNIQSVRCLMPSCAKDRAEVLKRDSKKGRKIKTSISPSELLQIGLSEETVKRYVMLKYKTELESDKNTIYCPRQWCGGAARSKKHKKPAGLDYEETSDVESDHDEEGEEKKTKKPFNTADLLAICEECNFAFCSRCLQTWHGEFVLCAPKRNKDELTEEEKASLEYLKLHTSPCPTCSAPAQKTHGCNHMICSRCETHFCYLCSAWLEPGNPYRHYNEQPDGKVTGCYMRLWELEEGDGDDVGLGFLGGHRLPAVREEPPPQARHEVAQERYIEPDHARRDRMANGIAPMYQPAPDPMAVAREAPLVLRLGHDPNVPQPVAPREAQAPAPAAAAVRGQNQRGRGGGAQRGGQQAARARGGRGGRGGRRNQRGRGQAPADAAGEGMAPGNGGMVVLDEAQQAWVRRFVEMALLDVEDEVEDDSDDDDLFWPH